MDPALPLDRRADLAVAGVRIAAILDPGTEASAARTLDVSGLRVTPGFIDLHVHVFSGVTHYGVDPDPAASPRRSTPVPAARSLFPAFVSS